MSNEIVHNTDEHRYEIFVDGTLAGFTEATEDGDVVVLPHTEIFDDFEGKGVAGELVSGALDDLRSRGKKVRPVCSYVARYIDRHSQYADLVA